MTKERPEAARERLGMSDPVKADARALWAVMVLDAWAKKHMRRAPSPCFMGASWALSVPIRVPGGSETRTFHGGDADAARIAAAEALVAEDPSLGAGL